ALLPMELAPPFFFGRSEALHSATCPAGGRPGKLASGRSRAGLLPAGQEWTWTGRCRRKAPGSQAGQTGSPVFLKPASVPGKQLNSVYRPQSGESFQTLTLSM